jgi:outer membrane protein
MMQKRLFLGAFLSLFLSVLLQADMTGGELSLGVYGHSPSGYASYKNSYLGVGGTVSDVKEALYWGSDTDILLKAYIEHPLPLFPNIKLAYTPLLQGGEGGVDGFTWGGIVIPLEGSIENRFEMKKYDLTLYYELLDNWVEIDAGVTLGYIEGEMEVTAQSGFSTLPHLTDTESVGLSLFLPSLYGKARFNMPVTDLSFQFEGDLFSYDETTYYTYEATLRYTFTMGLGIEGGWKTLHLETTDLVKGLMLDIDFSGPYAAIVWDF